MRYYGEIFGYGKNKGKQGSGEGFGIIDNIDDCLLKEKEVIFYKEDLLCDSEELRAGTLVSFEICLSNDNRIMAKKIGLLEDDKDADLIERCFNSSYETVWMSVLKNYTTLVRVEKGLPKVIKKLESDSSLQEIDFSEHIFPQYLAYSRTLRKYIKPRMRLEVCVRLLNNPTSQDALKEKLVKELADTIEYSKKVENMIRDQIERKWFVKYKLRTSIISPDELSEYLESGYEDNDDSNELLFRVIQSYRYDKEIINIIPPKIILGGIGDKLPADTKLNYYIDNPGIERDTNVLIVLLEETPKGERLEYIKSLGLNIVDDERFFPLLSPIDQIEILCSVSVNEMNISSSAPFFINSRVQELLQQVLEEYNYCEDLLDLVPVEVIINSLWNNLPDDLKLHYFFRNPDVSRDIDQFIMLLDRVPNYIKEQSVRKASDAFKADNKLFLYLDQEDQLEQLCMKSDEDVCFFWDKLFYDLKIDFLCKKAKEKQSLNFFHYFNDNEETNPLVKAVMSIMWGKEHVELQDKLFKEAHNLIQDCVIDYALKQKGLTEILRILPECPYDDVEVRFCEGRPWLTKENGEKVFCPRKNFACPVGNNKDNFMILPNLSRDFKEWKLLELLASSGIVPKVKSLANPDEYVNRLSGWVNRIYEIIDALKCTACGKVMLNNFEYSKNIAVYSSTVFSCDCGDPDNQNVYISHCWGCRKLIDSRKDRIQKGGFYLCLKCGSGKKGVINNSLCPKCGSDDMISLSESGRDFQCCNCNHKIHTPYESRGQTNRLFLYLID